MESEAAGFIKCHRNALSLFDEAFSKTIVCLVVGVYTERYQARDGIFVNDSELVTQQRVGMYRINTVVSYGDDMRSVSAVTRRIFILLHRQIVVCDKCSTEYNTYHRHSTCDDKHPS